MADLPINESDALPVILTDATTATQQTTVDTDGSLRIKYPPIFTATGTLNVVNATVSLDISKYHGCSFTVTLTNYTGTYAAQVSTDNGVSWSPCFFSDPTAGALGTTQSWAAASGVTAQVFNLFAGVTNVRLICTAFTSGSATALLVASNAIAGMQPIIPVPSNLVVTATAATGVAVTATLPAIASLYHKINNIEILKYFTAANAASATPLIVTTTNLPGSLAFSFGQPLGTIGTTDLRSYTFTSPLRSSATNTNTTIVCPATTGIIWRVTVYYSFL